MTIASILHPPATLPCADCGHAPELHPGIRACNHMDAGRYDCPCFHYTTEVPA